MKEHLNFNTLHNTICMLLPEIPEMVLVVEGPDDEIALKNHTSSAIKIISATGGKGQLLQVAEICDRDGLERVRFLMDRDYDDLIFGPTPNPENIFISTTHDCFTDLIYNDPSLLQRTIDVEMKSARRACSGREDLPADFEIEKKSHNLALCLAAARVANGRHQAGINFSNLSLFSLKDNELNIGGIFAQIIQRKLYSGSEPNKFLAEMHEIYKQLESHKMFYIGDHDLFHALSRILSMSNVKVKADQLHKNIILAARCKSFQAAAWFEEIQDWCIRHNYTGFDCPDHL